MSSSSRILIVCPDEHRAEISSLLDQGNYVNSMYTDGGEGAIELFEDLDPDVVILYANLKRGDAAALTGLMRELSSIAKVILVGDKNGPIRNALDATEFHIDRFIARPLVSKTVLFAVRTCVEAANRSRREHKPTTSRQFELKMATVMDEAIDDFVRTAMDALPKKSGRAVPRVTSLNPPVPPTPDEEQGRYRPVRSKRRSPHKRRLSSTVVAVPPPPGKPLGSPLVAQAPSPQPPSPDSAPPTPPTQGAADAPADTATDAPAPRVPRPLGGRGGTPRPSSGNFARELRRKMSDMAARLFPDKNGQASVDVGISHSHATDIDLSSFGVDTVVENPADPAALEQLASTGARTNDREPDAKPVAPPERRDIPKPVMPAPTLRDVPKPTIPASTAQDISKPVRPTPTLRDVPKPVIPTKPVAPTMSVSLIQAQPVSGPSKPASTSSPAIFIPPPESRPDIDVQPVPDSARPEPSRPYVEPYAPGDTDNGSHRGHTVITAASDELPVRGSICRGEIDAAILIERMYRRRFTGTLSFTSSDAVKKVFFDKGRLIFASSNLEHDRMGEQLYREGKITAAQLERVRGVVQESGRRMGEVLIEMGWLKRRELLPVVRRHIEDLVYSLFAWDEGTYELGEGSIASNERIRISRHPAAMILEGVRRKFDSDSLQALLGAPDSVVEIIDDRTLKSVMSVADLSSAERKVLASFDGERTLDEVHRISSIDIGEVYQLAYGLVVLGAASARRRGDDSAPAFADDGGHIGETDLAIDRQRVTAKYSLVVEADYFALLGVRRDATSFEVKRAYESARRDYATEGFPPAIRDQLRHEIDNINEVLDEAYQVLRDDALRTSYLANLRE